MVHNNREMTGFYWIDADAIEDDDDLASWVDFAFKSAAAKPPKDAKPAKKAPARKAAAKTAPARKRTPS